MKLSTRLILPSIVQVVSLEIRYFFICSNTHLSSFGSNLFFHSLSMIYRVSFFKFSVWSTNTNSPFGKNSILWMWEISIFSRLFMRSIDSEGRFSFLENFPARNTDFQIIIIRKIPNIIPNIHPMSNNNDSSHQQTTNTLPVIITQIASSIVNIWSMICTGFFIIF